MKIIYEVGDTVVFTDAWFPAISGDTAEIVAEEILPKGSKIYSLKILGRLSLINLHEKHMKDIVHPLKQFVK